jgi:hypothetical protein
MAQELDAAGYSHHEFGDSVLLLRCAEGIIGIQSQLSLPPLHNWRQISPVTNNERWAANGTVNPCGRGTSIERGTEGHTR